MILIGNGGIKKPRFWIAVVLLDFKLRLEKSANRRNPAYAKENGSSALDSKVGVANAFDHGLDFTLNS